MLLLGYKRRDWCAVEVGSRLIRRASSPHRRCYCELQEVGLLFWVVFVSILLGKGVRSGCRAVRFRVFGYRKGHNSLGRVL